MKTIAQLENELAVARNAMINAMDRDAPYAVVQGHKANVAQIRTELVKAKAGA